MIKINAKIDLTSVRSALIMDVFLEEVHHGVLKLAELIEKEQKGSKADRGFSTVGTSLLARFDAFYYSSGK